MSSPHIEVVPRIIDSSIAAAYQTPSQVSTETKKEVPTQVTESVSPSAVVPTVASVVVPRTFTEKFFSTLKDYLIPILFIIAVITIIYILWTYWTKYRIKSDSAPVVTDSTKHDDMTNPPEDLSKYILNTDDKSETDSNHDKLSVIDEGSEPYTSNDHDDTNSIPSLESEQEEESDDEDNDVESERDVSDVESLISEPDFSVISNLINQPISEYASDRFEYLNDDSMSVTGTPEDDTISLVNSIHTEIDTDETHMNEPLESASKVTKRAKKLKRMVL